MRPKCRLEPARRPPYRSPFVRAARIRLEAGHAGNRPPHPRAGDRRRRRRHYRAAAAAEAASERSGRRAAHRRPQRAGAGDGRVARQRPDAVAADGEPAARRGDAEPRRVDEDLDQAHHRAFATATRTASRDRQRAEEHHRARHPGQLAAGRARQQAVARRLRPGAVGGDRRRRAAERGLRIPVHAVEQDAAGLRDLHA